MLIRRTAIAAAAAGLLTVGACASPDTVTRTDLDEMGTRMAELERTNGRLRIRLQDTEERLFLLQDRVEANRINVARRDTASFQRVRDRSSGPTVEGSARRYQSPVTSSAPPPFPDVDPLVPSLPVTRLGPGAVPAPTTPAPQAPPEEEVMAEVIIDQAAFDARFSGDAAPAQRTASANRTNSAPRPVAPVDVGNHRLPTSDDSNRVLAPNNATSPLEIYRQAVAEFNEAEYADALNTLNAFVASGPEDDYMDNALFWMGECLYGLGRYSEALGYFQRVVDEYPDGNKVPDSLLKEALTYERLSDASRASSVLTTLVETYPTTDAAERARQRLRDLN